MENYEPTNIYNKMKYLSMDQGYVFYPSIEQYDGFGNIEKALNHRILQAGGSYTAVGKELLDMAEAERQKETLYLDQTFNFKFAFPLDFDADKNLFTVINECMQTSKIFKRHLAKFQHGYENNHKVIQPVAMVIGFGDYFMKTCDENLGNLFDRLEGNLDGDYTNIVNKWARDMVKLTIIAMLDSHVIGSKTRNEADPYYEDLRQVVQDIEDNENK